ncbi:MAG TPA: zf-HC2 domain-containing protein [Bryobacteraceae bacterium]|nr:zf-HC2 domain-containing protein [Bryobacteraceae bacterium]
MSGVHSEELVLLSYLDGELDAKRTDEVRKHLDSCYECRAFLTEARATLRMHDEAVRGSLPAPPRAWAELRPLLDDLDAERRQLRRTRPLFQPAWWAAAAAAIAMVAIVLRLSTGQTVSAAELLAKASAQEAAPAERIEVRTSKRSFIRAARYGGDPELAAMFRLANFDWERPLRARAFAEWRNGLSEKHDEVRVLQNPAARKGSYYRITTKTPEGGLSEVSVTIRAADLRPVEERFQFRNSEWVEISEIADQPTQDPGVAPPSLAKPNPSPAPTEADELRVFEALHRIGADLGEPIEVRRNAASVEVTVLGASASREREIRDAIGGLPHVSLRIEQPQAVRGPGNQSAEASAETPSGPVHSRLLRLMGSAANVDAFTNAALETSEGILARAHALRQLADRFSEPHDTLVNLTADHHRALRDGVARLNGILQPLTGGVEAQRPATTVDARALLGAAQRLDTLLTLALASPNQRDEADEVVARIRRALADLEGASLGFKP